MYKEDIDIYTHSGNFHADDVLCGCLAVLAGYNINKIHRVESLPSGVSDDNALIFDVGEGKYDHHQKEGVPYRDEQDPSTKYAAFGRMWQDKGWYIIHEVTGETDKKVIDIAFKNFDKNFIKSMDRTDNFGLSKYPNTLALLISCQNQSPFNEDAYIRLVKLFTPLVESMISKEVENAYLYLKTRELGKDEIVVLKDDTFISAFLFKGTNAKFIVSENLRGGYQITSVDSEEFPILLSKEEMEGCSFVHPNKFLASFKTKEQAVNAAKENLKKL